MKKKAFTLLELLVVITIIGSLTGFFILSFGAANERREIQLFADETYAWLQTARTDVSAGKKEESLICSGIYFEDGELPQKAIFDFVDGECELKTLIDFASEPEDLVVSNIEVADSTQETTYVIFVPPSGEMKIYNGRGEIFGAVTVELLKGDRKIVFEMDPLPNKISVNILNEE